LVLCEPQLNAISWPGASHCGEDVDLPPLEIYAAGWHHDISRVSYQIALLPALHLVFPAKAGGLWPRRVRDQRRLRSCGTVRFELWKMWAVGGFFIQKCGQDMPRSVINWSEEVQVMQRKWGLNVVHGWSLQMRRSVVILGVPRFTGHATTVLASYH
jgi:hypothetical protein